MPTFRVKCSVCQKVADFTSAGLCACGNKISLGGPNVGMVWLYRMGNFVGAAAGLSIYINGQPYGHIGNRQAIRIPLPYGTHNLHIVPPMSSRCEDLRVTLNDATPLVCVKAHIAMGAFANKVRLEPVSPDTMPKE